MASATFDVEAGATLAPSEVSEIWLGHLMSFLIPVSSLAFVWTGPHRWYVALLFIAPFGIFHWLDVRPRHERRQPVETLPAWPFDLIVYALAAIQLAILLGLVEMFRTQAFLSIDTAVVVVVVGGSSGFSIITAHELIHRRNHFEQLLGRLLLCTVLYEHFYTEHLRGHHVRVGTPEDPATAHFGETYRSFFRRTVPAQFRSAWRLEKKRLGDADMLLFDPRMLGNRIVHGLVVGWGIALAVGLSFGFVPFLVYVLQAFIAIRLLEAVNYFEHWGLVRKGRRVRPMDSWDTHSWFTYYGLIGLSRHADHHAYPSRPYQQLRVWQEAPVLPIGYVGLVDLVIARNDDFREMATRELRARGLGPFDESATETTAAAAVTSPSVDDVEGRARALEDDMLPSRDAPLAGLWRSLPGALRAVLVIGLVWLASAIGVAWESGGGDGAFVSALLRNGVIIAVIGSALWARHGVERTVQNGWISWGAAFAWLVVFGAIAESILG